MKCQSEVSNYIGNLCVYREEREYVCEGTVHHPMRLSLSTGCSLGYADGMPDMHTFLVYLGRQFHCHVRACRVHGVSLLPNRGKHKS